LACWRIAVTIRSSSAATAIALLSPGATSRPYGGYPPLKFDFAAYHQSYCYRMGGQYDGDGHLLTVDAGDADRAWREAGNPTQWRPPQ
jgi:hypothetical protein